MDNDAIVNGNMALNTVTVNNFVGGTIITTDPMCPSSTRKIWNLQATLLQQQPNADLELGVPSIPLLQK